MKKVTKKQRLFSKNFTTHSLIATKSIYYNEHLPYQITSVFLFSFILRLLFDYCSIKIEKISTDIWI